MQVETQKEQLQLHLTSDKVVFKPNSSKRQKSHYTMINGSSHQKDITTGNIYAPNIKPPKYIRHILTDPKVKIDNSTKAEGYFSTPISAMLD